MQNRVGENAAAESGNNLLRALRPADAALINPLLQPWIGGHGEIIYEPGDLVERVYFPCGPSMISYLVVLQDGSAVETALIKNVTEAVTGDPKKALDSLHDDLNTALKG